MNIFEEKIKGELSGLYLINEISEVLDDNFIEFLKNRNIPTIQNGNIIREEYDSFTIEASRNIQKMHSEKQNDDKKIFIIKVKYFTNEAQHSLLKLFEDTNNQNHFFIFSENVEVLLDTILSRAVLIKVKDHKKENVRGNIFLKNNKNKRLEEIADIVKSHKNDESSASLRDDARDLINSMELCMYNKDKRFKDSHSAWKFSEIEKARKYLSTPGASVKMILEHLALVL